MNRITRRRSKKRSRKVFNSFQKSIKEEFNKIEFALQYKENERKNNFMKWFTDSLIFIFTLCIGIIIISCLVK
jgi:hypothetical protein